MEYVLTGTLTKKKILRLFLLDYEDEVKKTFGISVIRTNGWSAEIELSEKQSLNPRNLMKLIKSFAVKYADKNNKKVDQHLNILRYQTGGHANEVIVGFQALELRTLTDNRSALKLGFEDITTKFYEPLSQPIYVYGVEKTRKQLKKLRKKSLNLQKFNRRTSTIAERDFFEQDCVKYGYAWDTASAIQSILKNPKTREVTTFLQVSKTGFVAIEKDVKFMPYKKKMLVL